jgi:hypothetical protein
LHENRLFGERVIRRCYAQAQIAEVVKPRFARGWSATRATCCPRRRGDNHGSGLSAKKRVSVPGAGLSVAAGVCLGRLVERLQQLERAVIGKQRLSLSFATSTPRGCVVEAVLVLRLHPALERLAV